MYQVMAVHSNNAPHIPIKSSLTQDILLQVKETAKGIFHGACGSHDWDHTLRVYHLCDRIGKAEKADLDVVRIAALLHDIGRSQQDKTNGDICHARQGAHMAREIIRPLPLSEVQRENVVHCIRTHRFRGGRRPETIEAKVLFDADKLDSIGAVGVARAFLFAGEIGARLHNPDIKVEDTQPYSENDTGYREYRLKLRKIKNRMLTDEGKKLADKRHRFMAEFFKRFINEYKGKG
jgi:uncharacterized protein